MLIIKLMSYAMRYLIIFSIFLLFFLAPSRTVWANVCVEQAHKMELKYRLPNHLLKAIASTESGYKLKENVSTPWPWTVNVQGKGHYFKNKSKAIKFVAKQLKRGIQNIDIGCMQINYRWHKNKFKSIEAMMSPKKNVEYAAQYLTKLKKRYRKWSQSIGFYHSKDHLKSKNYYKKVSENLQKIQKSSFIRQLAFMGDDSVIKNSQVKAKFIPLFSQGVSNKVDRGAEKYFNLYKHKSTQGNLANSLFFNLKKRIKR